MEENKDATDLLIVERKATGQIVVSQVLEKIHLQLPLVYYIFFSNKIWRSCALALPALMHQWRDSCVV